MMLSDISDAVDLYLHYTVLGIIEPCELGFTLPHEQLLYDISNLYVESNYTGKDFSDMEFSLSNIGYIRQYP